MNDVRLIDANALKFQKVAEVDGILTHVLTAKDINNAPTVKINDKTLEIARKSIELGRKVGKLEGKLERTQDDMYCIYDKLGNRVNHELTVKFIESGYDLSLVRPKRGEKNEDS